MRIHITFTSPKYYEIKNIIHWVWAFRKFTHVKGFYWRILGVYLLVLENNATELLIKKAQKPSKCKHDWDSKIEIGWRDTGNYYDQKPIQNRILRRVSTCKLCSEKRAGEWFDSD